MITMVDQGPEKTCIVVPASQLKGAIAITLSVHYEYGGKEFCEDVILAGSTRIVDVMHNILGTLKDFEMEEQNLRQLEMTEHSTEYLTIGKWRVGDGSVIKGDEDDTC